MWIRVKYCLALSERKQEAVYVLHKYMSDLENQSDVTMADF